jgi:hypothetical protein
MLANHHYIISDDLLKFDGSKVQAYNTNWQGKSLDIGFAAETFEFNGQWYRSGCIGRRDYWRLGFTQIEWVKDEAFKIVKPSKISTE